VHGQGGAVERALVRAGAAFVAALLPCWAAPAAAQALPPEIEAVKQYILVKEYPEVFKDEHYRTRIENALTADIDGDGRNEVVVHFHPHYRQSPTIVIYRLSKDLAVTRVIEGLAPGALQPISGDYLDSHVLGEGVDLDVTPKSGQSLRDTRETVTKLALERFGGVVAYATFWHVDGRTGGHTYVDMTAVPNAPEAKNCEAFEFSKVRQVAFGAARGEQANSLAVWVNDEVHLYTIKFRDDGFLAKTIEVLPAPPQFNGFLPGQGLAYAVKGGTEVLARPRGKPAR
jgi:hypothetical protein